MFVIWYTLFSIFYLVTFLLHFLCCNILKFNKTIFNVIFFKIDYLFNFYSYLSNTLIVKNNISSLENLSFKNRYAEYTFFLNKNIQFFHKKTLFENIFFFCSLNNSFFKEPSAYSLDLNYLIFLTKNNINSKNINSKKINLNYFFNNILVLNTEAKFKKNVYKNSYSNIKKKFYLNFSEMGVILSEKLNNTINSNWIIKFSPSNFIKYINYLNTNTYNILYLRKAKVFNKGRYSRNRQYYRTGVYWCLYVNIIAVVGIYFWFYRFTMNFGYLWWLLFLFICSFIVPKAIKYRFYNPINLFNSVISDILWFGALIFNSNNYFFKKIINLTDFLNVFILNSQFFKIKGTYQNLKSFLFYYLNILSLNNFLKLKEKHSSIYSWEFNYTDYYYNSVTQAKPVFFQKIKLFYSRFIYIVFLR